MFEISFAQLLLLVGFLSASCISLVVYIYKNQTARINMLEIAQKDCPINKVYTIVETTQTDISWIKEALQKKT